MKKKTNKTFSFNKNERLNSRNSILRLIKKGKIIKIFPFYVRVLYQKNTENKSEILVNAPKRIFKRAVDRNRIKRLIREAYRLNKNKLFLCLPENNTTVYIHFNYIYNKVCDFETINNSIKKIINIICQKNIENE